MDRRRPSRRVCWTRPISQAMSMTSGFGESVLIQLLRLLDNLLLILIVTLSRCIFLLLIAEICRCNLHLPPRRWLSQPEVGII